MLRALMFVVVGTVVGFLNEYRQMLEAERQAYSKTLEQQVEERTSELRKEKGFLENIIATVPDSLLVLDSDLRIKSANRSFYETFQTEPEKVIGSSITGILGDDGGKLSKDLGKVFGTGKKPQNFELHYQSEQLGERRSISRREECWLQQKKNWL